MARFQRNRFLLSLVAGVIIPVFGAMLLRAIPSAKSGATPGVAAQATQPIPQADAPAPPGNAQNGKQLLLDKGCADCHGSDGKGTSGADHEGPQIAPPPFAFAPFVRQVRHPTGMMDAFTPDDVSDAELADIYAFLQSPPQPPKPTAPAGHPDNGKKVYLSYGCNLCHGREGQGSAQPPGPRIGPSQLALAAFVSYVRQPKRSMPPYSGKVLSNSDLIDIYAFLQLLPAPLPAKSAPPANPPADQ